MGHLIKKIRFLKPEIKPEKKKEDFRHSGIEVNNRRYTKK